MAWLSSPQNDTPSAVSVQGQLHRIQSSPSLNLLHTPLPHSSNRFLVDQATRNHNRTFSLGRLSAIFPAYHRGCASSRAALCGLRCSCCPTLLHVHRLHGLTAPCLSPPSSSLSSSSFSVRLRSSSIPTCSASTENSPPSPLLFRASLCGGSGARPRSRSLSVDRHVPGQDDAGKFFPSGSASAHPHPHAHPSVPATAEGQESSDDGSSTPRSHHRKSRRQREEDKSHRVVTSQLASSNFVRDDDDNTSGKYHVSPPPCSLWSLPLRR